MKKKNHHIQIILVKFINISFMVCLFNIFAERDRNNVRNWQRIPCAEKQKKSEYLSNDLNKSIDLFAIDKQEILITLLAQISDMACCWWITR